MKTNHYEFIDALRGYAILLVMAVHASQASPQWLGIGRQLVDQGARGVQLFFVTSALTLLISWNSRKDGILPFYLRRLFRIAPMFWIGILFFLWLDGLGARYFAPNGIDEKTIFFTAIFLHGWHPEAINSVVHGGWSIAVEMTFYLLFPIINRFIRNLRSALVFFVLSNLISNYSFEYFLSKKEIYWPGIPASLVDVFLNLWFPMQLPVFASGFILFFLIRDCKGILSNVSIRLVLVLSLIVMMAIALGLYYPAEFGVNLYAAYGVCFCIFAFCLASGAVEFMVNKSIRHLGKISFSAYLWHFAIIGIIKNLAKGGFDPLKLLSDSHGFVFFLSFFPIVVVLTVIFSTMTYKIIEKPMIRVGNKLIEGMEAEEFKSKIISMILFGYCSDFKK